MKKDIAYYKAIQNAIGCETKSDWIRNRTIKNIKNSFENPIDVETFKFWNYNMGLNNEIRLNVIDEKYSEANGQTVEVTSLISSPIKIGNVFYRTDTGDYYICIESFKKSKMFYEGKLVRCKYWMKWQDMKGNVFDYPAFEINSTQYNSGESGNKTVTLGSSQHLITIIADENTIQINHGLRMFWDRNTINPSVFKVTQNDTTAMNYDNGLLRITITEDQFNPDTDSIENWICDYIKVDNTETNTSPIEISYTGEPVVKIGRSKTFKVENSNSVEFSLTVPSIFKDKIILEQTSDNSCKVKVENDSILVGSTFKLTATDTNNSTTELLIEIGGI